MTKEIMNISIWKLKRVKCYLTYKGARELSACDPGLKLWKKKGYGKLEARDVILNFKMFCPACFIANAVADLSDWYTGEYMDVQERMCTCQWRDMDGDDIVQAYGNTKDVEYLTLVLRAVIIAKVTGEHMTDEELIDWLIEKFGTDQWYMAREAKVPLKRLNEMAQRNLIESSRTRCSGSINFKNKK